MCTKLHYISFPVSLHYDAEVCFPPGKEFQQAHEVLIEIFTEFSNSIAVGDGKTHVKYIDFENYHDAESFKVCMAHRLASSFFLRLCENCNKKGVKLLNVQPVWLIARPLQSIPGLQSLDLGIPIVSLVNMDPCVFSLNMPNLEMIEIRQTCQSFVTNDGAACRRPSWTTLKILKINVDKASEQVMTTEDFNVLYDFFFKNIVRHQLTELSITFETERKVACPSTKDIVQSCPNLRNMKISNWPGTNKALTRLWSGLPALEQVTLENCTGLGNSAFIGKDVGKPVFLKLKCMVEVF